jgi:hypothetical protein
VSGVVNPLRNYRVEMFAGRWNRGVSSICGAVSP